MTTRACILLVWAACVLAPAVRAAEPATPANARQRYDVLVERNMFTGPQRAKQQEEAPPPERFVVLTGIVRQDGEYIAFFEDRARKTVSRARLGDTVLAGRITGFGADSVEYSRGESAITVKLGQNLEGGQAGSSAPTAAAPAASPGAAAAGSSTGTGAAAGSAGDMLEQLRQRRLKELGK